MIPHGMLCVCPTCSPGSGMGRRHREVGEWWSVMSDFFVWSEYHGRWCDCWPCQTKHYNSILTICQKFGKFPAVAVPTWLNTGSLTEFRKHQKGKIKVGLRPCSCLDCHRMVKFHYEAALDRRFIEHTLAEQKEERENMTQAKAQESTKQAIEIEIAGKKYTVHVAVGAEVQVTVEQEKENVHVFLLETYTSDHVHNSALYMGKGSADEAGREQQTKWGHGYFVTEIQIPEEMFERNTWHAEKERTDFAKDLVKHGGGKLVTTGKWKGPQKGQSVDIGGLEATITSVIQSQPTGMFYDIRMSYADSHVGSVRIPAPTWATLGRR